MAFEDLNDKDWDQLQKLPKVVIKDIIAEQQWRQGLLNIKQLSKTLNVSVKTVETLGLNILTLFRPTSRGLRQVKCVHRDDLRAWLAGLNPSFADYDPEEGPLLTPAQAAEQFAEVLPECVQLSLRTRRYRPRPTQKSISEQIMES
jgi:hypothetical protein